MTKTYELETFWRPMLKAYCEGKTAQPPFMGLDQKRFEHLYNNAVQQGILPESTVHQSPQRLTYRLLFSQREDEKQQIVQLLRSYGRSDCHYLSELTQVVAHTCLGSSHLWSDLGLPNRRVLGELIRFYYPELHQKNQHHMRWKRFFYRQLCEQGGDYVCRAPSCEECSSYSDCFIN